MDSDKIRELTARVEDHRLDFKSSLYTSNEELAKDLMAIANVLPPGSTGHIILGVKQLPDDTGEIVGVALGAERDSHYQQKVAGRLNRSPQFTFFPIHLPEGDVGVFEVTGIGERPYFPLVTRGNLNKFIPQKRLGSSTAVASPDEVREWVLEDRASFDPATLLSRVPSSERDKFLVVADLLTASFSPVNSAPLAATLLSDDHAEGAATFHLQQQKRNVSIPFNNISAVFRDGSQWRVLIDGYLRNAGDGEKWEFQLRSRARLTA
jgi:hypothetical protein